MKTRLIPVVFAGLLFAGQGFGQSGAIIPQGGAGHAGQASCVILKRMGPADQVTSRLYSFGIRGKQFQYVEGKLPEGFPFHGRLTDHDVRNLQGRGAEVIILNQNYTSEELQQARDDCRGETGRSPNQTQAKPGHSVGPTASTAAAARSAGTNPPASMPTGTATPNVAPAASIAVFVTSMPDGADITVDGKFVGSTPSNLQLAPGDQVIRIEKSGYKAWQRTMTVATGALPTISATLEKE